MFLNPWYGQVGAGPATEDEATTTTPTEVGEATAATVEINQDDGVKEDSTSTTATSQESPATASPAAVKPDNDNKIDGPTSLASSSTAPSSSSDQAKTFQNRLKCGWTAHMTQEGRLFYCK